MTKTTSRRSSTRKTTKARKPRALREETGFDIRVTGTPAKLPTVADVLGKVETERVQRVVSYPANWWEAVWDRFAPIWAKLRWPTRFTVVAYWEDAPRAETLPKREVEPRVWSQSEPWGVKYTGPCTVA